MADYLSTIMDDRFQLRFWQKVKRGKPNECWLWQRATVHGGYGHVWIGSDDRTHNTAHRVAWEMTNAREIEAGLDACHSCDNPGCVNPAHIWPGTTAENMQDCLTKGRSGGVGKANALKTHCKRGHPLSGANLKVGVRRGRPTRTCITCQRMLQIEHYRRHKAAQPARRAVIIRNHFHTPELRADIETALQAPIPKDALVEVFNKHAMIACRVAIKHRC
jgi:hypothetical protein